MDPALVSAGVTLVGIVLAFVGGWSVRKKATAETEKALAERDKISVDTATSAVKLANEQMGIIAAEQAHLRASVEAYRKEVEKATAAEVKLRTELASVKRRVAVLEEYIKNAGLPLPT